MIKDDFNVTWYEVGATNTSLFDRSIFPVCPFNSFQSQMSSIFLNGWDPAGILKNLTPELVRFSQSTTQQVGIFSWREILWLTHNSVGWNELSDPDMRTANFEISCDVYREGVYSWIYIASNFIRMHAYSTLT